MKITIEETNSVFLYMSQGYRKYTRNLCSLAPGLYELILAMYLIYTWW